MDFISDLDILTEALREEASGWRCAGLPESDRIAEALDRLADRIARKREDLD